MRGQFDDLTTTDVAIAGASSGFLTRALIQPFDVLKIRFQLQVEPIATYSNSKYSSILQASKLIYREEGITAFWKGHVPAQLLSVVFGLMQFWCFEVLVREAKNANILTHQQAGINFVSGSMAGIAATCVSFPFDVMRTRLIAQNEENKVYGGVLKGYAHIIKHEGFFGLYKGLTPTIIAVAPNAGLQFMFYKFFDGLYKKIVIVEKGSYNVVGSVLAGSMAGFFSKSLVYPLDLTRKRMQIQGFQKYRQTFGADFTCVNMRDCIAKICEKEGFFGLFKGMSPSILKALVSSAISFGTFELVCTTITNFRKIQ